VRVTENRVLRRIFGPKRDEVTGGWRKLHNEKLHNLYSSPNIIQVKEDAMSRACSTNGEKRNAYRILVGTPEGKNHKEDQGVGGRIILKWILEGWDGVIWTGLIWLRIWIGEGLL
jgi:hypothetical protein